MINKAELNVLAEKAADRALRNRKNAKDNIFEDDDAMEEGVETINIEEAVEFDIFDYCEREFVAKGDYIDYMVRKNGALTGTVKHPFSWDKIQKKYGEGRYKIIAKSKTTGRVVKTQSQEIDGVHEEHEDKNEKFNPSDLVERIANAVKPKNEGPSFMELIALMNQTQSKTREEAERAAERARNDSDKQTSTMIQMMQENTKMMMLMFQGQKETKPDNTVQLAQLIQSFAEKMENRFEKALDKIQNSQGQNKSEFGMMEMLKMKEEAQDRGFKMYSQLNTLAEAKAQEKVDMIEEYRGEGGGEKKEKSVTETLIETMIPTIANALAQSKSAPAPVQPRGVVRPQSSGQRIANAPAQTLPKANIKPQAKPSQTNGQSVGQTARQNNKPVSVVNSNGLPKANFNLNRQAPIVPEVVSADPVWVKNTTDLLLPVFTEHLIMQTDPNKVAPIIIDTLINRGISREEFLNKVKISDILDVVKGFELPVEAYPWFEEIYADIKNETRHNVGEHTYNA